MKKFVLSLVCTFTLLSYVDGDEFYASITKVEGNTITYKTSGKNGKKNESAKAAKNVAVLQGEFEMLKTDPNGNKNADGKRFGKPAVVVKPTGPLPGGLASKIFTDLEDKAVGAQISTNEEGLITQIIVTLTGKK